MIIFGGPLMALEDNLIEFRQAAGQECNLIAPQPPSDEAINLCRTLITEESRELRSALAFLQWADRVDLKDLDREEAIAHVAKEIVDTLYVVVGTAVAFGIPLDDVWDAVHASNMTKVRGPKDPTTGKVLKPVGYKPPDIKGILFPKGDDK